MRALLVLRPDAGTRLGGDVILARHTAAALADFGVAAYVAETARPDARGYDVAHVFGIFEPEIAASQVTACRRAGVALALSPIWTDRTEFFARAPRIERTLAGSRNERRIAANVTSIQAARLDRLLGRRQRARLVRAQRLQGELMRAADVLLPNAITTARECAIHFGISDIPFVVVPVAFDHRPSDDWNQSRAGVVCVARVESLKNQALLAFALRGQPVDITLVGETYDAAYAELCRRWGAPRLRIAGQLAEAEVRKLLAGAAVHAMPSWGDLPGIASLEAAAAGTRLVVGNRGAEMEYFQEDAAYADPADPDSIRAAVLRELAKPPRVRGDALDRRVAALTWHRAAEQTLRGYEIALSRHRA